jgi:hypothetical protein
MKSKYSKIIAILACVAVCFAAGWFVHKSLSKPEIITKVEVVERQVLVEKTDKQQKTFKITNIQKKPDQSEETTIIESSESIESIQKVATKDAHVVATQKVSYNKNNYKVGPLLKINEFKYITDFSRYDFGISAEVRLPLDIWFGGFIYKSGEFGLGLSMEL